MNFVKVLISAPVGLSCWSVLEAVRSLGGKGRAVLRKYQEGELLIM